MTMTKHVIVNPFFPRSLKSLGGTSRSPFGLHTSGEASRKSQSQVLIIAALLGVWACRRGMVSCSRGIPCRLVFPTAAAASAATCACHMCDSGISAQEDCCRSCAVRCPCSFRCIADFHLNCSTRFRDFDFCIALVRKFPQTMCESVSASVCV